MFCKNRASCDITNKTPQMMTIGIQINLLYLVGVNNGLQQSICIFSSVDPFPFLNHIVPEQVRLRGANSAFKVQ